MALEEYTSPEVLQEIVTDFLQFLGALGYAILIVVIGWIVGTILSEVIKRLLDGIKFEQFLSTHKVEDSLGATKVSNVIVKLVKYYIILIFLSDALRIVQLGTIGELLVDLVKFAPVLFGGIVVIVVTAMIGELVKEKILEVSKKSSMMTVGAKLAKALFIYVGFVVAMGTMGFDVSILEQSFATFLQGLAYGIALAVGIAFGLGGQETAKDFIKKGRKKLSI